MQNERKKNIIKLLNDKEFIEWLINPSPSKEEFWKKNITVNSDEMEEDVALLKSLMKKLEIKEPILSQNEKVNLKRRILSGAKKEKRNRLYKIKLKKVYWAAAVATLFISSYYFLSKNPNSTPYDIDYQTMIIDNVSDTLPSNLISLTTNNKEKILLDGDSVHIEYNELGQANVVDKDSEDNTISEEMSMNRLTVPYGKISNLTLSDGTRVWVNSGTTVIYPSTFAKEKREIYVDGEIFLDVAKKEKYPFHVKTSQLDIQVKGTSFNVTAYSKEDNQSVILVSGIVDIKSSDKASLKLKPNQLYQLNISSNLPQIIDVDTDEYTAWINRYLLFKDKPLSYVLRKLSKQYNTNLIFDEEQMKNSFFNGKLDLKEDINTVLDNISVVKNIDYVITDQTITIQLK